MDSISGYYGGGIHNLLWETGFPPFDTTYNGCMEIIKVSDNSIRIGLNGGVTLELSET
ncbi:MAG: hypothetical protein ACHQD9_08740 [Chitinophagales bacterium]